MSLWAKVGEQCVCVTDFWQTNGIDGPVLNEVVTIAETYLNPAGLLTLRFQEHYGWMDPNMGVRHGYSVLRFRPMARPTLEQDVASVKRLLVRDVQDA